MSEQQPRDVVPGMWMYGVAIVIVVKVLILVLILETLCPTAAQSCALP